MRNELAAVVKKASTAIGVGLLEQALEQEGVKGCSPLLCTAPVPLEPPYQRFDASSVLHHLRTPLHTLPPTQDGS